MVQRGAMLSVAELLYTNINQKACESFHVFDSLASCWVWIEDVLSK